MSDQDWTTVTFKKRSKPAASPADRQRELERARVENPESVATVKKYAAGSNKQRSAPIDARKLDTGDGDVPKVEKISRETRVKIQQGRQAKGWTQAELAQKINEKVTVVQEYEAGRAVPSRQVLNKISRQLGVAL